LSSTFGGYGIFENAVDVSAENYMLAVARRNGHVFHDNGNRFVELEMGGASSLEKIIESVMRRMLVVGQERLSQLFGIFNANAAVREIAAAALKQMLLGSVVKKDGICIGEFELHLPQRIGWSRLLENSGRSRRID
jgi:hypothetical protein